MATGVNLVTEVEKLNMATKFVAPVIALALLVIVSSVGKPPVEKSLFSRRKNSRQFMFAEEESNGSRCRACVLIFPLCHGRVSVLSLARCQTFCNNVAQMNAFCFKLQSTIITFCPLKLI